MKKNSIFIFFKNCFIKTNIFLYHFFILCHHFIFPLLMNSLLTTVSYLKCMYSYFWTKLGQCEVFISAELLGSDMSRHANSRISMKIFPELTASIIIILLYNIEIIIDWLVFKSCNSEYTYFHKNIDQQQHIFFTILLFHDMTCISNSLSFEFFS